MEGIHASLDGTRSYDLSLWCFAEKHHLGSCIG